MLEMLEFGDKILEGKNFFKRLFKMLIDSFSAQISDKQVFNRDFAVLINSHVITMPAVAGNIP